MENNVRYVRDSEELREGARALAGRAVAFAKTVLGGGLPASDLVPGGRKCHALDVQAQLEPKDAAP
jgi:hypothetical protein